LTNSVSNVHDNSDNCVFYPHFINGATEVPLMELIP
jgi:hypothetical protein